MYSPLELLGDTINIYLSDIFEFSLVIYVFPTYPLLYSSSAFVPSCKGTFSVEYSIVPSSFSIAI